MYISSEKYKCTNGLAYKEAWIYKDRYAVIHAQSLLYTKNTEIITIKLKFDKTKNVPSKEIVNARLV